MVVVNTGNVFDLGETLESLIIREPIFGTERVFTYRGAVNKNEYNTLTWIVGETHFALIVNNEVRYCGSGHPYMQLDLNRLDEYPIIIGSNSSKVLTIKSIAVSKIKAKENVKN